VNEMMLTQTKYPDQQISENHKTYSDSTRKTIIGDWPLFETMFNNPNEADETAYLGR
jgi:hypothetical protein